MMPKVNIKTRRKLISSSILAEATQSIALRNDITSGLGHVRPSVALAGLAGRSGEGGEFGRGAAYGLVVDDQPEQTFEQVVEGCQPVHPAAPEVGESGVWDDDTAERDDEEEEHGHQEGGQEFVRREAAVGVSITGLECDWVKLTMQ